MKLSLFLLSVLLYSGVFAQHTLSGTFSPAQNFNWLLIYELKPEGLTYLDSAPIAKGEFSFVLPEHTQGTYRIVYAIPQDEFYFDFIYNGKEDINFAFDEEGGVKFLNSVENVLFQSYITEITHKEEELLHYYTSSSQNAQKFSELITNMQQLQQEYDKKSQNLFCNAFIKANAPYVPTQYKSVSTYIKQKRNHFLDVIDFNNLHLQHSDFLIEKARNYVYASVSLENNSSLEKENTRKKYIQNVQQKLTGTTAAFKLRLYLNLWKAGVAKKEYGSTDFIYVNYLKPLAEAAENSEVIVAIEQFNRLRIGAIAPTISWEENGTRFNLENANHVGDYLLVFWSSTCSHCLEELPKLHRALEKYPNLKVLAVGLEDDESTWKIESQKLYRFSHTIALGKWESDYAKRYAINQTPTYYMLDTTKRIKAKPENYEEVLSIITSQ